MRFASYLAVLGALIFGGCSYLQHPGLLFERKLKIAANGKSDYQIVIAQDASPSTKYGAEELRRFVKEMSGAELPIVTDEEETSGREIILGDSKRLQSLNQRIDFDKLGDEGYMIRAVGPHLVIAGGELRGNLYGVYGLLEDHLGCRWFTPEVSRIPKHDPLILPRLDETVIPPLEYREPFVADCFDGDWCARNRMNSSHGRLDEKHGGKITYVGFVHTFNQLVPPEKYFDEHPEYFSLVNGKRIKDHTQLCTTNEDVKRIVTEEILKRMRENPDAEVFSVSQNDWYNYCQCDKCQALAKKEGSQMAPVLALVNYVADHVKDEFPDKIVDTLAYQWTRKAPKTMRPRPNVVVRLCSIECCFSHPLATCDSPENAAFRKDMEDWSRISDRLWVWNYCTDFSHYFLPFPNRTILNDNVRFYRDHSVRGIFELDTYSTPNGEFSKLAGYMMAKFLWNPEYDEDKAMNEFLEAYYGPAAEPIRDYIDLLERKVADDNIHMHIFGDTIQPYLTDDILARAEDLFDQAEAAVADQPEFAKRVRIARLSPTFAKLEKMKRQPAPPEMIDHDNFRIDPDPEFVKRINRFIEVAKAANVSRLNEGGRPPEQYREESKTLLEPRELTPLEAENPEDLKPGISYQYFEFGKDENIVWLPDYSKRDPKTTGTVSTFSLEPAERDEQFGFWFRGYFEAPRDGVYTFNLHSDDGSILYLGSDALVHNNGVHENREATGYAALKAGWHRIQVIYFQHTGDRNLDVECRGPGIEMQPIPASALAHVE